MAKLWGSGGLNKLVEAYTVGEDYRIDSEYMLPHDIKASAAHAAMLGSIGVLTDKEVQTVQKALEEVKGLWENGKFTVSPSQEDGHTAIEQYITEKYGEVGKKIHTGRSRNDQSMTMIRLYALDQLRTGGTLASSLASALEKRASELQEIKMPGYTHMQRAMPATVGMWLGSYAAGFRDSLFMIQGATRVLDQNPLGSAAGFGINGLVLDRKHTTSTLKFARVQENPMYCGLSRGFFREYRLASNVNGGCPVLPVRHGHDDVHSAGV